jgi:hypothetical protein
MICTEESVQPPHFSHLGFVNKYTLLFSTSQSFQRIDLSSETQSIINRLTVTCANARECYLIKSRVIPTKILGFSEYQYLINRIYPRCVHG